jgi:hypothetical protein
MSSFMQHARERERIDGRCWLFFVFDDGLHKFEWIVDFLILSPAAAAERNHGRITIKVVIKGIYYYYTYRLRADAECVCHNL